MEKSLGELKENEYVKSEVGLEWMLKGKEEMSMIRED